MGRMGPDPRAQPSVPPLRPVVALLLAVAAAVLLAGPLHGALRAAGARPDFPKVFRYLALGLCAAALVATLRPWRDVPPDRWGLRAPWARTARLVLLGLGTVAVLLALLSLVHFAAGQVTWDRWDGAAKARHRALKFGLAALPFACLEEVVFRGWVSDRCARRWRPLPAALVSAVVFAALHAARKSAAPSDPTPDAAGALAILAAWGERLVDVADFGPSFLGLLAFALALEGARRRFGTLAFGVGAHAAVYVLLQVHSALTDPVPPPGTPFGEEPRTWLGGKWLYDGVPGLVALGLLAFCLWPRTTPSGRKARPSST